MLVFPCVLQYKSTMLSGSPWTGNISPFEKISFFSLDLTVSSVKVSLVLEVSGLLLFPCWSLFALAPVPLEGSVFLIQSGPLPPNCALTPLALSLWSGFPSLDDLPSFVPITGEIASRLLHSPSAKLLLLDSTKKKTVSKTSFFLTWH